MPVTGGSVPRRDGAVPSIWFGMRCDFTRQALIGATEGGSTIVPVAIVLPRGPTARTPGWPEPPFDRWLRDSGIAIIEVDRLAGADLARVRTTVSERGITMGVAACFPFKIPTPLREAVPNGVLNIHPSLLPALRGPEPVFHTYRLGLDETGVSVHVMDAGWDSGPVIVRERLPVPEAGSAGDFEAQLAKRGGELLSGSAPAWCAGELAPEVQDESLASWAPVPDDDSRTIPSALTVARAERFLEACGPLLAVDADSGDRVAVARAVAAEDREIGELPDRRMLVRVACSDGTIWAIRHGLT